MRIYKVLPRAEWEAARVAGVFTGSAVDVADGFIHFSTAGQLDETLRRHFAGQADLLLVGVESSDLGGDLKWEPSRGGALFPHLYGPMPVAAAVSIEPVAGPGPAGDAA